MGVLYCLIHRQVQFLTAGNAVEAIFFVSATVSILIPTILKNGLSELHYRFRRYSTLTKTVLLESQYLQSYDSLPDF